jgi:aspartyl-tRNA(Asn)/glutamyl-tRNA(Gln) amidotransferase subunit C
MIVNEALVDKLANLARLTFDATEKANIQTDLQNMIAFVEKLNEVNTNGVAPLQHMGQQINVLREDVVKGSISQAEGLKNSPVPSNQYFKVPKVIQ